MGPLSRNLEAMNRVRWRPTSRRHMESFYLKANAPNGQRAVWVRCTLLTKDGRTRAEAWAIYFDRERPTPLAFKSTHSIDRARWAPHLPGLAVGACCIDGPSSHGLLSAGEHGIAWRLELLDRAPPYRALPRPWMYESRLVGQKIESPHPSADVVGWLELHHPRASATRIDLDGWRGMQAHTWGHKHSDRYAWCHSNALDGDGVEPGDFFEGFSVVGRIGGVRVPMLTFGRLVLGGVAYGFEEPSCLRTNQGRISSQQWTFEFDNGRQALRGSATSEPALTAGLTYDNPVGAPSYCLNSKLATLELELRSPGLPVRRLRSRAAALEVLQQDANHGVTMLL